MQAMSAVQLISACDDSDNRRMKSKSGCGIKTPSDPVVDGRVHANSGVSVAQMRGLAVATTHKPSVKVAGLEIGAVQLIPHAKKVILGRWNANLAVASSHAFLIKSSQVRPYKHAFMQFTGPSIYDILPQGQWGKFTQNRPSAAVTNMGSGIR
ncbi:hypothetical protein JB92DRAFT_2829755 [Gautieria morchelliformis]|nr:hypothetical protein JB92DRAFT_2829755 [Gautieria morchelliformis]